MSDPFDPYDSGYDAGFNPELWTDWTKYPAYPPAPNTPPLQPAQPPIPSQLWPVDEMRFRNDMPEFADTTKFISSTVTFWLAVAQQLNNPARWMTLLPVGIELLAAHYIVGETQALNTANSGGMPGLATGPVGSKSVAQVSISYAVQAAMEDGAGSYNTTIYGQRWWHLAQLIGAGPIQF